ncbi:MAG: methyltransferase domain-containing protein [Candidatus Neomarinimicrobiota bacterium]|nr:methyltransferase domain-containing protein [Candidatus Neomarinimicrobiota bacterium]
MNKYVHGYSDEEANRLNDQADSLADLLHCDSIWDEGSIILEAGCGIGAQTKIIAPKNKNSKFVSIDISSQSLNQARKIVDSKRIDNVEFQQANLFELPFGDEYFDHIFLSFVLEHIPNPIQALSKLKRVLKKNGTITLVEGDHGSAYFHPDSDAANKAIQCQVKLQKQNGGDANIGRKLYPLLVQAGFEEIKVSARQVYVDDSNPKWVEGFTKNTFTAMIKGISEEAISKNLISKKELEKGIKGLNRTAEGGGTFCYTFFKGIGTKE